MKKKSCKLIWSKTRCVGKVFNRNLSGNAYIDSCKKHFQVYKILTELRKQGMTAEELKKMSCVELAEELKRRKNTDGEKVLADT